MRKNEHNNIHWGTTYQENENEQHEVMEAGEWTSDAWPAQHTPLSHKLFHRYQFQLIRRSSLFSEYQKPEANKKTHVTRVQWQCGELNALRVHLTNAFSTKTARSCGSIEQFIRRRIALFITK